MISTALRGGELMLRCAVSAAGKVVDRHWYNKNKHIYPASRWAPFDEAKQYDGKEQSDRDGDGGD